MSDKILYNVRKWLNPLTSTHSGNLVITRTLGYQEELHVEISDCRRKIILHNDPLKPTASKRDRRKNIEAFLKKIRILISELQSFEDHLLKSLEP